MAEHYIEDASALNEWRKSSYSGSQGDSCVEVNGGYAAGVPVRDSKCPTGPALLFAPAAWSSFINAAKRDEFSA